MTSTEQLATLKRDLTEMRKRLPLAPRTLRPVLANAIRRHEERIANLEATR